MPLIDLASLSSAEFKQFLDSFDNVLCDCDGVLWLAHKVIEGTQTSLDKLRKCGKDISFVSNNCALGLKGYQEKLSSFKADMQSIVYPTIAIIDYLKSENFDKELFVSGTPAMVSELEEAGFKLTKWENSDLLGYSDLKPLFLDNEKVGAVVFDIDINVNFAKIYKASQFLKRPDVLFIAGATDKKLPVAPGLFLMGPGYFQDVLAEFTNREPLVFGKPGIQLSNYITKKIKCDDTSRTLFIGDSLDHDMKFATNSGFQKLLVLTGVTTMEDLAKCEDSTKIPDYYVNSLGDLNGLIKNKLNI